MKLCLKRAVYSNGRFFGPGDELIVDEVSAKRLIAKGCAIAVESEEETKTPPKVTKRRTTTRRKAVAQ